MAPHHPLLLPAPLLALVLVAAPSPGGVQAQELEWAKKASTVGWTEIAADSRGNSHVTGSLHGTATFDMGEASETVLMSTDSFADIFVARYDPDGTLRWAKSAGGGGADSAFGIAIDGSGNSYITGFYSGPVTFGAGELSETALLSAGSTDVFVAKYAPDGTLLWAKSAGGSSSEEGYGIAADSAGNTYVTGQFTGTATFGAGESNETVLIGGGIFVAKYAPDGNLLWATIAGSPGIGLGIATDGHGNSYVTGVFGGTATFGAGESNETVLIGGGIFVAKYAPDGRLLWARSHGTGEGHGIASDGAGNAYVIATSPVTGRLTDILIAKYGTDGSLSWAKSAGGADADFGLGIATDGRGNSYVTGAFGGTAVFGEGEANETMFTALGLHDIFIAKYAPDGNLLWATIAGGGGGNQGSSIATDGRGNSYATGLFGGTAVFGEGEANETVLTGGGTFVAKYADGGGEDSDGDGVPDGVDFCPGTVLPEAVPTSGRLLPNRFAITDEGPAFSTGKLLPRQLILPALVHEIFGQQGGNRPGLKPRPRFTIFDTQGCSCEQIIDYLRLGEGHRKFGCSLGVMRTFTKQLPE